MDNKKRFNALHVQKAFASSATRYDAHAELQQEVRDECLELAKAFWGKGARILDAGTGTGALAQSVKKEKLGWELFGLDLAFDMCKTASNHAITVVNANAEALPFADNSFDGVFSSLMLQWANDPLELFKEYVRVLKPGGRCVLSTFTHGTLEELRESFATLDKAVHVNDFGPPNYFSALAVHAGLRVLSSEESIITEYFPSVISLMRELKAIGASTKQSGTPRKGLMTPSQLERLEASYRYHYAHKDGIPVTWQVMIAVLEKP